MLENYSLFNFSKTVFLGQVKFLNLIFIQFLRTIVLIVYEADYDIVNLEEDKLNSYTDKSILKRACF